MLIKDFTMFSGGIVIEYWPEMGKPNPSLSMSILTHLFPMHPSSTPWKH